MFRLFGPCSRAIVSPSPSTAIRLSRSVHFIAKYHSIAQNQPFDSKLPGRRSGTPTVRKVNLKKLFSEEESEELSPPASPRRPNILHSSSIDEQRSSSIPTTKKLSSTQAQHQHDISDVDDYQNEERRRRIARQTQTKMFNNQPKRMNKKSASTNETDRSFDESALPPYEHMVTGDQKQRISEDEDIGLTFPKQPRRERSITGGQQEVLPPRDSGRHTSAPLLYGDINEATDIRDLLAIFDKYVVPTEFALGLQKMYQLASSSDNNDTVQIYSQSDDARLRMESLLLSFLGKFSDHEVMTAITFVMKFYPEDNEFTDRFSLGLNTRLRRISVHQLVRVLEQLKSFRHTAQWIHRVYNRLLILAEGRYFEFDNIRDILALTYKLSYNDRLINRLDERILEISDSLTFDDWFKILINKSMLKRRDRTIIRAACYHLLKLSESILFPVEKLKDCLLACSMLNVHDKPFLDRLTRDCLEQINSINDAFTLQSILTSMGTLRLRHCELLDAIGRILLDKSDVFLSSESKCLQSFVRTCAAVNYSPPTLSILIEHHLTVENGDAQQQDNRMDEIKNRIDLIWSLAILDRANQSHVTSILNQDVFQLVQEEVTNSKIGSALKLLAVYSYSLQKFSKKFLKPTFNVEQLAQQLTLKSSNAQDQVAKTITAFAEENKHAKFNVVTSNMIVIDCLMVVDKAGTPQDLSTFLISGEGIANGNSQTNQTTFNKVRVEDNRFKIAFKCLDYQNKTLLTNSVSGSVALQLRLLASLGYKCVPIHYDEFVKIQVPNDRIKYVQRKIKEALHSPSGSKSTKVSSSSSQRASSEEEEEGA